MVTLIQTLLKGDEDKTLSEIGIDFSSNKERTTIKLLPSSSIMQRRSAIVAEADSTLPVEDDELALGASASQSPVEPTSSPIPLPLFSNGSQESTTHNESIPLYPCKFQVFN